MSFSSNDIRAFVAKHKWSLALIIALGFGYTVGKDMALRDNRADQMAGAGVAS
ncbi:MAG: hypothetical protein AAF687_07970 [Pseudomonadota bacterium]